MIDESFSRSASELFLAVVDLPDRDRAAALADALTVDPPLHAEVESLLAHDGALDEALIDHAIRDMARSLTEESVGDTWIGRRIGSYRVLEQISEGGMAVVFLAERADERFEKKVAIKLVKRPLDFHSMRERFLEERRILAQLEHPYVAKLLDAGETEEGTPYLVMEYVAGQPIHRYVVHAHLTLPERCRLLARVCEAVEHAHRNLVVHQDLKPSNVLITPDGTPKLLDFGIAKLLGSGQQFGQRAGTPDFAAPELWTADRVTTAADVYSLGAILHHVLPLDAVPVPGDLTVLAAKASAAAPAERYQSVTALRQDLERWVEDRPLEAIGDRLGYRAKLFLRRHRWPVAIALAVSMLLTASLAYALWKGRQADQRMHQLARLAGATVTGIHDSLERIPGATTERRAIVGQTLRLLEEIRADAGEDAELGWTVASGYQRMGLILGGAGRPNLGDTKQAMSTLRQSIALSAELLARSPNSTRLREVNLTSTLRLSSVLTNDGRDTEARQLLNGAIRTNREWLLQHSGNPEVNRALGAAELQLARLLNWSDLARAIELCNGAIGRFEAIAAQRPEDREALQDLASAYSERYELHHSAGDTNGAFEAARKAAEMRERLVAQYPGDALLLRDLLISYGKLGDIAGSTPMGVNLGNSKLAYEYYRKANDVARQLRDRDPANQNARFDAAMAALRAGMVDPTTNAERRESRDYLRFALAQLEAMRTPKPSPRVELYTANVYQYLGARSAEAGDFATARRDLETSMTIARRAVAMSKNSGPATSQLMHSHLAAVRALASRLGPAAGARLIAEAESELTALLPNYSNVRHFAPEISEVKGDALWAWSKKQRACDSYRESQRQWTEQEPQIRASRPQRIAAVQRKLEQCH